jgi:hypothetical protein
VAYEKIFVNPEQEFNGSLDVSQLLPGAYVIRFEQGGQVYYSKLIKK